MAAGRSRGPDRPPDARGPRPTRRGRTRRRSGGAGRRGPLGHRRRAPVQPARPPARELFGADCDTEISGSTVTARCHNGYPQTDLVRLHVECDRWWDLDGDSAPVPVGPAGRVELTSRCWKEVRSAWVTHQRG
ncbi:hypothetical protein ACU4GG_11475 [Streptomyces nojiriensis]